MGGLQLGDEEGKNLAVSQYHSDWARGINKAGFPLSHMQSARKKSRWSNSLASSCLFCSVRKRCCHKSQHRNPFSLLSVIAKSCQEHPGKAWSATFWCYFEGGQQTGPTSGPRSGELPLKTGGKTKPFGKTWWLADVIERNSLFLLNIVKSALG